MDCIDLCKQKIIFTNCNCSLIQFSSLLNTTLICNTATSLACAGNIYYTKLLSSDFLNDNCVSQCPLECNIIEYNAYESHVEFNSDIYLDVISNRTSFLSIYDNETLSEAAIRNGLSKVNVYYGELAFTQITESASMNEVSLMASIGECNYCDYLNLLSLFVFIFL